MAIKNNRIMTFKVDHDLKMLLDTLPNKSAFIRSAVLAASRSTCPMCRGTGMLTEHQRKHWKKFEKMHDVFECKICQSMHIRGGAQ
ncbi:CopG family transcriptional regulator [bacterium]|nr:CopG family transcriptional regulator [bacterium]